MNTRLSICIPTRNRARFLDEAIESVVAQAEPGIEIVVSDNASADDTAQVVARWKERFPSIVYFRWEEDMGADTNFLKVVDLAQGEYCWLLGSDDKVAPGGIREVLEALEGDDILLLDYTLMSYDMSRVLDAPTILQASRGTRFRMNERGEFHRYLETVRTLSGLFAYISSLVFRKVAWNEVETRKEFVGSAWIHVTKMLDILRRGGVLYYLGRPLVLNRSGNDSFLAEVGPTRRILIDLGYVPIVRAVFAEQSDARNELLALLEKWWFSWHAILGIRRKVLASEGREELKLIEVRLFQLFPDNPQYWLKRAVWPLAGRGFLDLLHSLDRARRFARARVCGSNSL